MDQEKYTIKKRSWKQITEKERYKIEALYEQGFTAKEIAEALTPKRNRRTIEREIEKGLVEQRQLFPIYDMAKSIGKDDINLRVFMPLNASVHQWEPSPKNMKDLSEADLLIVNGANMESWLRKVEEALPELKIVKLSDNADLISYLGASSLGDFQYMFKGDFNSERNISFGHTHEEFIRIAFIKDEGFSKNELIEMGKAIMADEGELIKQEETIKIKDKSVYKIEMGHYDGYVNLNFPNEGSWIVLADRKPQGILPYSFNKGNIAMETEIIYNRSTSDLDKITYDPHSWLSLTNGKRYAEVIGIKLGKLVPEKAKRYERI